jgi:hypothetical protein
MVDSEVCMPFAFMILVVMPGIPLFPPWCGVPRNSTPVVQSRSELMFRS